MRRRASIRFAPLLRPTLAVVTLSASRLLAGCGTTRNWAQKSSGHPATFGTSVPLPLPGEKR